MAENLKYIYAGLIFATVLVAGGLSIGVLVVNQNLSSLHRVCIDATSQDTGSGSVLGARGELSMKTSEEVISYAFHHLGLNISSIHIMGPIVSGTADASSIAITLCGLPCSITCDTLSVANEVAGTLYERCNDNTGIFGVIRAIRANPSRYYVQFNTLTYNSGKGELRAYLTSTCGSPV